MKLTKYMWEGMISLLIRKEGLGARIAVELMKSSNLILETRIIFRIKTKLEDMGLCFCKVKIWIYNMEVLLKTKSIKILIDWMSLRDNLIIQALESARANKFLWIAQTILKAAKKVQKIFSYKKWITIKYCKIH